VGLIRDSGNSLSLTIVTPCDKTYYKLPKGKSLKDISPHSTTSSSSGVSSSGSSTTSGGGNSGNISSCNSSNSSSTSSHYGSINSSTLSSTHTNNKDKRNSWNPFKRSTSRELKLKAESLTEVNVILR